MTTGGFVRLPSWASPGLLTGLRIFSSSCTYHYTGPSTLQHLTRRSQTPVSHYLATAQPQTHPGQNTCSDTSLHSTSMHALCCIPSFITNRLGGGEEDDEDDVINITPRRSWSAYCSIFNTHALSLPSQNSFKLTLLWHLSAIAQRIPVRSLQLPGTKQPFCRVLHEPVL